MAIQIFERQNPYPQIMSELYRIASARNTAKDEMRMRGEEMAMREREAAAAREFQVAENEANRQFQTDLSSAQMAFQEGLYKAQFADNASERARLAEETRQMFEAQTNQIEKRHEESLAQIGVLKSQVEDQTEDLRLRKERSGRAFDVLMGAGERPGLLTGRTAPEDVVEIPEDVREVYLDRGYNIPRYMSRSQIEELVAQGKPGRWTHGITDVTQPGITREAFSDMSGLLNLAESRRAQGQGLMDVETISALASLLDY